MNHDKSQILFRHCLALLLFLCTTFAVASPLLAYNEPPDRPTPGLPARPTLDCHKHVSIPCPSTKEQGSHIRLIVQGPDNDAMTVVQWQGGDGEWHDVDGWRGELTQGQVLWFVKESDLAKGPFRWKVELFRPVSQTVVTEPFMLPVSIGEEVTVTVVLTSTLHDFAG